MDDHSGSFGDVFFRSAIARVAAITVERALTPPSKHTVEALSLNVALQNREQLMMLSEQLASHLSTAADTGIRVVNEPGMNPESSSPESSESDEEFEAKVYSYTGDIQ
jgi:hypothetical protein